uniref:Uncharacterized protein n=1 Tax=Anguilla anguilla TaxID=7936 RepID=A0A0E9S298_ANGAN
MVLVLNGRPEPKGKNLGSSFKAQCVYRRVMERAPGGIGLQFHCQRK